MDAADMTFQSTPPVKAATDKQQKKDIRSAFQSTPPVKAATMEEVLDGVDKWISIHAAREGGDGTSGKSISAHANFNPRRP